MKISFIREITKFIWRFGLLWPLMVNATDEIEYCLNVGSFIKLIQVVQVGNMGRGSD